MACPPPSSRATRRARQLLQALLARRHRLAWALYGLGVAAFLLLPLAAHDFGPDEKALLFSGLAPAVRSSPWLQHAQAAYAKLSKEGWPDVPALLRAAAAALPGDSPRELEVVAAPAAGASAPRDSNCSSAHTVARALRGSGVEALAIILPVDPRGQPGVAALAASIAAAAAKHLEALPWMAKDVVLVLVDRRCRLGAGPGVVQAWLESYTSPAEPTSAAGGSPGLLQQAVVLELLPDGPANRQPKARLAVHGWAGQLPNIDMPYLVQRNWEMHTGIPIVGLGGQLDLSYSADRLAAWLDAAAGAGGGGSSRTGWRSGRSIEGSWGQSYAGQLLTLAAFALQQAAGSASEAHAPLLRAGIDAATVTLSSAAGTADTAGAIDELVLGSCLSFIEAVTRTLSNLEERLHHASQLYLLAGPTRMVPLGAYFAASACPLIALLLQFWVELDSSPLAAHPAWRCGWALAAASHAAALLLCFGAAAWRSWTLGPGLIPASSSEGPAGGWALALPAAAAGDAVTWAWLRAGAALAVGAACLWRWAAALQQSFAAAGPSVALPLQKEPHPSHRSAAELSAGEEVVACLRVTALGSLAVVGLAMLLGHWALCSVLLLAALPCLLATQHSVAKLAGDGHGHDSSSSEMWVQGEGRTTRVAKLLLMGTPAALFLWGAISALSPEWVVAGAGLDPAQVLAAAELCACLLAACLSGARG